MKVKTVVPCVRYRTPPPLSGVFFVDNTTYFTSLVVSRFEHFFINIESPKFFVFTSTFGFTI